MKLTLLTQAALAISSISGAVANPTPDVSSISTLTSAEIYFSNRQCYWGDDGKYYVDVSVVRGPAGHDYLMSTYNGACKDFERLTECKAIKQF
ncbi:hypothetical protein NXS19_004702 [Fusarium pseudograminearum]|nr:hypothetical protein NXS19_004702 [Fusarium pseudograminearum]